MCFFLLGLSVDTGITGSLSTPLPWKRLESQFWVLTVYLRVCVWGRTFSLPFHCFILPPRHHHHQIKRSLRLSFFHSFIHFLPFYTFHMYTLRISSSPSSLYMKSFHSFLEEMQRFLINIYMYFLVYWTQMLKDSPFKVTYVCLLSISPTSSASALRMESSIQDQRAVALWPFFLFFSFCWLTDIYIFYIKLKTLADDLRFIFCLPKRFFEPIASTHWWMSVYYIQYIYLKL